MKRYLVEINSEEAKDELKEHFEYVGEPKALKNFVVVETEKKNQLTILDTLESVTNFERDAETLKFGTKSWALDYLSGKDHGYRADRTGKGVDIFVMDTGIRPDHTDFSGRVETVYSFDGRDFDENDGHGTGSASCAAGEVLGIAKEANILNVRYNLSRSDGLKALDTVLDRHLNKDTNNPSVLNMSFGSNSSILKNALRQLYNNGVVLVAAAGNDDTSGRQYPASNPFVISVMANNRRDKPSEFTNYSDGNDIFAPGTQVPMADPSNPRSMVAASGTSFASPLTAGVMALIVEGSVIQSSEAVDQAKQALLDGAWSDFLELSGKYEGLPNLVSNPYTDNEPIQDLQRHTVKASPMENAFSGIQGRSRKEALKGEQVRFKFDAQYQVSGDNPGGAWEGNVFVTNPIHGNCEFIFE